MRNKKSYYMLVAVMSVSVLLFTGCGSKAEPVNAEPTETVNEVDTEESLETTDPTPSPTVETTEEPVEESSSNEESESTVESEESSEEESLESEEPEPDLGYTIIPMDDTTLYVTKNCNVRSGPSTDYDIVDSMTYGESAVFNGYVEQGDSVWYVIKTDNEEIKMVSKGLVSSEKPQPQQSTQPSGGNSSQPSGGGSSQPSGDGGQPSGGGGGSQSSGGGSSNPLDDILGSGPSMDDIPDGTGDGSGAGGLDINWQ